MSVRRSSAVLDRHGLLALAGSDRARSEGPGAGLGRAAAIAALVLIAIVSGWLVATGDAMVVAGLVAIAGFLFLAADAPGPLAALLLLAVLNGVPVFDLSGRLNRSIRVQDAAVLGLAVLLFAYRDRAPNAARAHLIRLAMLWSATLIGVWVFAVGRSVFAYQIPTLKAISYGRDFLYFAILLPLALSARLPPRSLRSGGLLLFVGILAYAAGATVIALAGLTLPWLVHPGMLDTGLGVTRVYAPMSSLVNSCLIFAGAFLLSRDARGRRDRVLPFVLLLIVAASLQLTRANYFALAVAFVAGLWFYLMRGGSGGTVVVRTAIGLLLVLLAVLSFTGGAGSGTSTPVVGPVVSRVEIGLSDLSQSSGTVGYRETVDRELLHVLGGDWPLGLGFLPPAFHYVTTLPSGSIRNSDTGVFNALMTMGIVGVLLVYAPLAYAARELWRANKHASQDSRQIPDWLIYGGAGWIAWAVAGSPTLVILFGVGGLVVTSLVLGTLGQILSSPDATVATQLRR